MTRILIIEDEKMIRDMIVLSLQREYQCFEASDGAKGIQLALEQLPDLILCDISMPEMDGYQVLEQVRAYPETRLTPFIFLTAMSDRPFVRHAMELGADDYVTKPFTPAELQSAIKARLDKQHIARQNAEQELAQAQKQLTQTVTHELRTPLVSIIMAQELLSRQIDYLSSNEIHEMLGILRSGSHRLNHLVEQTVLMTQIETGGLSEQSITSAGCSCQLWELFIAAESMARKFAYRRREGALYVQANELTSTITLKCSKKALTHAMAELIANALDFSPDDREVVITHQVHGDSVTIQISDEGSGIAAQDIDRALRYFQQINRERQEQQGMGLGLPLAARIIELHGGSFKIDSDTDKGTTLSITLPLEKASEAHHSARDRRRSMAAAV